MRGTVRSFSWRGCKASQTLRRWQRRIACLSLRTSRHWKQVHDSRLAQHYLSRLLSFGSESTCRTKLLRVFLSSPFSQGCLLKMPPVAAKLIPMWAGGGSLPTLELERPASPVSPPCQHVLGRNVNLGMVSPRMSRRLCTVQWGWFQGSPRLLVLVGGTGGKTQGRVRLNENYLANSRTKPSFLGDGDILALITVDNSTVYEYRVEITSGGAPSTLAVAELSSKKRRAPTPPSSQGEDEFTCPICLDILVNTTTAVPCGHSFCSDCLGTNLPECPTCRSAITGLFANRALDHAIRILMDRTSGVFSPDNARHYRQRTHTTAPAEVEPQQIQPPAPKSAKGDSQNNAGGANGTSAADAILLD